MDSYYCPGYTTSNPRQISVYCVTQDNSITYEDITESYVCNGVWVLVDQYGNYFNAYDTDNSTQMSGAPDMEYTNCASGCDDMTNCTTCTYSYGNSWSFGSCTDIADEIPTSNEFTIVYHD